MTAFYTTPLNLYQYNYLVQDVLTAKRHEQKDGADDEHLTHGEVAQQYHDDDEVERYSDMK